MLSRYTVLPWEDEAEYQALLAALVREHTPQGPTEEHLIEELAGIIWRKRRLRLSEAVSFRRGLHCALDPLDPFRDVGKVALVHLHAGVNAGSLGDAIRATAKDTDDAISGIKKNEALTRRALDVLALARRTLMRPRWRCSATIRAIGGQILSTVIRRPGGGRATCHCGCRGPAAFSGI